MEKKKTAVEYAVEKLEKFIPSGNQIAIDVILDKAKEMERIQIIDASATAYEDMFGANGNEYGENYYNKKFNN